MNAGRIWYAAGRYRCPDWNDMDRLLPVQDKFYVKKEGVFAHLAGEDGFIETLEGVMEFKALQHYIVSDAHRTHSWPVRKDIFERTYREYKE